MKKPFLCTVGKSYLLFLRNTDSRVPHKPERPFVANVIELGGFMYAIPLTSQIVPASGKPRARMFTSYVPNSHGKDVSAMLYNNMIPVSEKNIKKIDIKNDTYNEILNDEATFARTHAEEIFRKAAVVYDAQKRGNNRLANNICCNYTVLEKQCRAFNQALTNGEDIIKGPIQR